MKFAELGSSIEYKSELAKLQFAIEVNAGLKREGINQAELADRLGVSRAMISKLLRGDANVTIETMVRLAEVLHGEVFLKIVREGCSFKFFEVVKSAKAGRRHPGVTEALDAIEANSGAGNWSKLSNERYEAEPIAA